MSFLRRFVQQDHDLVLDTAAVAVDNVFTTFASVVTAANARSGLTRVKVTQSVTVSSGSYDLSRIIFVGDFNVLPILTLNSTTTVTGNPPRELINVSLENGKSSALWTLTTAAQMTLRGLAAIGGATNQLIELNGNNFDLYFEDGANFATVPAGLGVVNNANATTSIVYFKNNSTSTPDANGIAVSGAGTMDLRYFPVSGNLTHVELSTLFTTVNASLYKQQAYTVSPAQITATANDYTPVGLEHSDVLRINSNAAYDITGFDATNANAGWFTPYKLVVNSGGFALTIKHQNAGSTASNRFITSSGTDLVLGANGGSAIVYYDNTDDRWRAFSVSVSSAGEANTASNVGTGAGLVFKQKTGVDLEFKRIAAGYAVTVTNGTNDVTIERSTVVTTLTDAATIAVDADLGPNYMVTLAGNRTLGNPTNSAVGKELWVAVAQDGTGGRTLAFDTNFIAADASITINATASAVSIIHAVARDFGGGVKWYYTVTSTAETGSGEANTASNVGSGTGLVFKQKTGVNLEFRSLLAGYGLSLTNNTNDVTLDDKVAVTTLTDGATIAIDAAVGPKYEVTIAGNRTLSNPTNGVAGRWLVIGVKQDATGGRTLAFDTDFIAAGQLFQVAQAANAVSVVVAEARTFGGTLKWYYTIHHGESTYQVAATIIAATGTLTATANFSNGDTVTTGSKTYTFQTALTNVNGNVLIGASASDSLDNLIAAINLGAGSGTVYAAATTANGFVSAAAGAGDTLVATALFAGSVGNSIATTETSATASWGGATLSGGVGDPDYTTTGFSESTTLRSSTNATYNFQGMVGTASQGRKKLINVGSFNLVIKHQDTGATAANRFICPGGIDVTMTPDDALDFEYDKTASRWRLV